MAGYPHFFQLLQQRELVGDTRCRDFLWAFSKPKKVGLLLFLIANGEMAGDNFLINHQLSTAHIRFDKLLAIHTHCSDIAATDLHNRQVVDVAQNLQDIHTIKSRLLLLLN